MRIGVTSVGNGPGGMVAGAAWASAAVPDMANKADTQAAWLNRLITVVSKEFEALTPDTSCALVIILENMRVLFVVYGMKGGSEDALLGTASKVSKEPANNTKIRSSVQCISHCF